MQKYEDLSKILPSISIVIPTYNSEKFLPLCLQSINDQDYPKDKLEIIIIDGGSTDRTIDIAKGFGVTKILHNSLRTGEAGKAIGVKVAINEIIAFIDSDNILDGKDWFKRMVKPFQEEEIAGVEPLYYSHRRYDGYITRYCALIGMNDPLCLFLGNYDRYSHLTGRWTGLRVNVVDRGDYLLVELNEKNIPTMGANGFMVRAEALKSVNFGPYLFDVDMVYQLVKAGWNRYAKVKTGIVHLFADSVHVYIKKTKRRIGDYLYYERVGARKYPWRCLNELGVLKFILHTLSVAPLVRDSLKGYNKLPDRAWLFHPLACWLTLFTYGITYSTRLIAGVI
jgi:glycosyltransferase involved in cell wall biosynthesis